MNGLRCAALGVVIILAGRFGRCRLGEELAAQRQFGGALPVGKKAVIADAVKAVRRRMEQKAADEFASAQAHQLAPRGMAPVAPAEADVVVGDADEPTVGDGDAVGIAAEIGQDLFGSAHGGLA